MMIRLKPFWSRATVFIVITIALTAFEILLFSLSLADNSTIRLRALLFAADASLLYLIYWFVAPKLRFTAVILSWILTLYLISNSLFYSYWGDLFTLPSIFETSNYNSFVVKGALGLWSWPQTVMTAISIAVTVLYLTLQPRRAASYTTNKKLKALLFTILIFSSAFYLSARSILNWHRLQGHPDYSIAIIIAHRYDLQSSQIDYFRSNGLTGYLIAQINNYPDNNSIELNDTERQSISKFIEESKDGLTDTSLSFNRDKNLVFIIVESLNSYVLDIKYGNHELTPNLNRLINSDGSVSCTTMYAQIGHGGSSDGQLIYNTGLLPVKSGIVVQDYCDNTFPSLVKSINPSSSAEFIVENATVYNHHNSSKAFGYDCIYDSKNLKADTLSDISANGADETVLNFALRTIKDMPQPFVAEITTLTMHYPFEIDGFEPQEWIDSIAPGDFYTSHYLQTVHYTDRAIGNFVDSLFKSDLGDNTIVVIASDHDTTTELRVSNEDSPQCLPIVFLALNTGINLQYNSPIGQVDVYPTILDIMGVSRGTNVWRGLGSSILAETSPTAVVSRTGQIFGNASERIEKNLWRAFNVSDSIIRSDFFRQN